MNKKKHIRTYQVISKKYRPQTFAEVCEQHEIVTTLKNALRFNRIGNAYLFCGPHGTGKTTLARLFAKAINCQCKDKEQEPCNQCQSCIEIKLGTSLDLIEIDGASTRGIDDIRNLTETAGYTPSSGNYKIYLIDEVHMLTKEAFNALLKTLEDPPLHALFFFATTEPHKILPTVISRCQRFDLKRIAPKTMMAKLKGISTDLQLTIDDDALYLIATHAEGSLRDAELLLDQVSCFAKPPITAHSITAILGLISQDLFFELDSAIAKSHLPFAFELTAKLFKHGFHLSHFLDSLVKHYRHIALIKLGHSMQLSCYLSKDQLKAYSETAKLYSDTQCLDILDILTHALERAKKISFNRIQLEVLLLKLIRSTKNISIEHLVDRLITVKNSLTKEPSLPKSPPSQELPSLETPLEKDLKPKETPALDVPPSPEKKSFSLKKRVNQDRVLQFAAVELNGHLKKE